MAEAIAGSIATGKAPWLDAVWGFFCSVRLTAACAALLLLGGAIGLLVEPAAAPRLASMLELHAPLRSWWFTLLLLLLWLNLLALAIERLPRRWGNRSIIGAAIAHVSLLVALGAAIVDRLAGFEGKVLLRPDSQNDSMTVLTPDGAELKRKLGFIVRCDGLRPGQVDLRIFERLSDGSAGRQLATRTLSAGHPLRHGGLTLREDGAQPLEEPPRAQIAVLDRASGERTTMTVREGEEIEAAPGLIYAAVGAQDDVAGHGPALQMARTENGRETRFWIFQRAPDFDLQRGDRFSFVFDGMRPALAARISVTREPALPVIFLSCGLFLVGVVLSLAFRSRS